MKPARRLAGRWRHTAGNGDAGSIGRRSEPTSGVTDRLKGWPERQVQRVQQAQRQCHRQRRACHGLPGLLAELLQFLDVLGQFGDARGRFLPLRALRDLVFGPGVPVPLLNVSLSGVGAAACLRSAIPRSAQCRVARWAGPSARVRRHDASQALPVGIEVGFYSAPGSPAALRRPRRPAAPPSAPGTASTARNRNRFMFSPMKALQLARNETSIWSSETPGRCVQPAMRATTCRQLDGIRRCRRGRRDRRRRQRRHGAAGYQFARGTLGRQAHQTGGGRHWPGAARYGRRRREQRSTAPWTAQAGGSTRDHRQVERHRVLAHQPTRKTTRSRGSRRRTARSPRDRWSATQVGAAIRPARCNETEVPGSTAL